MDMGIWQIMGADDDELLGKIHCGEDFGKEGEHGTSSSWKWRLVIAYDGTQYLGWQWQPKGGSVQYMIEDALMKVTRCTRKDLLVVAASRTDAGVHAWGQVAHFVTPFCFERLDRLHLSLNGILPQDIRIREIAAAQPNFHARYYAHKKMYHYTVYVAAVMDPCQRFYAWHVRESLNIGAMTEAAQFFVGVHDFTTFANSSKDSVQRDLAREILSFNIVDEAPILRFEVEGTGFFYKQVRNMVSLLLEVGKGILPPRSVCDLLASHDRTKLARVCVTAPPQGLCLISVSYDEIFLAAPRKFHLESTHHLHHV
ncbi:hypothetical protein O6H91_20G002600 [Diphasiastrum complanatum]|uniref:Uncharacterized protein n=1 Tax=Diphasiastrum complanatum TaxID=34168 RepID=A0ACC2AMI3_DIPCM|nr:hypothetical protein O6H91_20G002600 [Diphasiastrum complanatum]